MPVAKKAPVRPKRTKAEVQDAFEEIREETARAREAADPKLSELAKLREAEVRQSVEGISVESEVQRISALGLEISKALTDVSGKLVQEVQRLASVREAVTLETAELGRLHKIDVAATALDQLVQDHAREKEQLDAEIAAQRTAWEQESLATERERKENEELVKKQRQREIEDYEYKKTQERKKAQDKYDEEQRLLEKRNKEKQEELDKNWKQREIALKEQEDEVARLRKDAEGFPARLKKEAEEAAAAATRAAEQKSEREVLLLHKDVEAEKRMAELEIKGLHDIVARQSEQLSALQKQLDEAKQQVQDIAVRAIEGASGARALSHINQIAMEQAKNRPQS
jgi:hypothetical protein